MRGSLRLLGAAIFVLTTQLACAQGGDLSLPKTVEAGSAFSIQTGGSGKALLYVVGLGQVVKRDIQLGEPVAFAVGDLHNAGHYIVVVTGASSAEGAFDVLPAKRVANVSFLAKPSRISVGLHDGISGAVYIFDAYQNLITAPMPVSFELSVASGAAQSRSMVTRDGEASTQMDSATKEGAARFVARVGDTASTRIIQEVPGEPCGLRMSARPAGKKIEVSTDPLRDCGGNAVPDGTIVTFTEVYGGSKTTVDVPLKRGIAEAQLPAYDGAHISAATGVVMGNEIRWGR